MPVGVGRASQRLDAFGRGVVVMWWGMGDFTAVGFLRVGPRVISAFEYARGRQMPAGTAALVGICDRCDRTRKCAQSQRTRMICLDM